MKPGCLAFLIAWAGWVIGLGFSWSWPAAWWEWPILAGFGFWFAAALYLVAALAIAVAATAIDTLFGTRWESRLYDWAIRKGWWT
jgi:hypothetical protein